MDIVRRKLSLVTIGTKGLTPSSTVASPLLPYPFLCMLNSHHVLLLNEMFIKNTDNNSNKE